MIPTALRSIPSTVAVTAQVRIAPAAIRTRLGTMPILKPPFRTIGEQRHNERARRRVSGDLHGRANGGDHLVESAVAEEVGQRPALHEPCPPLEEPSELLHVEPGLTRHRDDAVDPGHQLESAAELPRRVAPLLRSRIADGDDLAATPHRVELPRLDAESGSEPGAGKRFVRHGAILGSAGARVTPSYSRLGPPSTSGPGRGPFKAVARVTRAPADPRMA